MIYLLSDRPTIEQVQEMLKPHGDMIKVVVDIRRGLLAGGGSMHADCEEVLLDQGSAQDDLWGANWFPADQHIEFESLINIRPRLGNRSMVIQDAAICQQVETITRRIFGGLS